MAVIAFLPKYASLHPVILIITALFFLQINSGTYTHVTCAVFNYNGTEILGSYNDEDIYLFDTRHPDGSDFIHRYEGHRNNATGMWIINYVCLTLMLCLLNVLESHNSDIEL